MDFEDEKYTLRPKLVMLSSPGILERGRFLHKAVTHPTMYVQWALIGEETIRERIKRAARFSICAF